MDVGRGDGFDLLDGFCGYGVDERALTDLVSSGCSQEIGAVAQLGEHLLCKQGVSGSIPLSSTILCPDAVASFGCYDPDGPPNDRRRPLALRSFASFEAEVMLSSEEKKFARRDLRLVPVLQKS